MRLRSAARRVPVIGPAMRRVYVKLFRGEGQVRQIERGPLSGVRYHRYEWSTPWGDLVETNCDDAAADAFARLIPGKRRVFDVGANWGFYCLLANKHRSPGCHVFAFEPHPRSARELRTQLLLNAMPDVTVVEAALADREGRLEFVDTGSAIGQKLAAVDGREPKADRLTVRTITLDQATERYGPPDLVKLDVEGAESLVLAGGAKTLTEARPVLVIEVHGAERADGVYDPLERHGYRFEQTDGTPITGRTYHHHVVALPR